MRILTMSNLYPRPDKPVHGMYNAQLFDRFARHGHTVYNWCLVPAFNLLRWPAIAAWRSPHAGPVTTTYQPVWYLPVAGRSVAWRTYGWSLGRQRSFIDQVDVVYAAWMFPDGVAAAELARRSHRPYGLMAQGSDLHHLQNPRRRTTILQAVRDARAVVCVSESLRETLAGAGALPERLHVAPNGVDHALFAFQPQAEARRRLELAGEQRILLFVGHLWPVKTVDTLLRAFRAVRSACGPGAVRLFIVGDGPERRRLEALTRTLGLQEDVRFCGAVAHDRIPAWLNAADCLCLSSRSEGMPNVVIEALACGCPVVATDVGACRELLHDEPATGLVPPGDPAAFAEALRSVLRLTPDRRGLAARNGRRFSWDWQAEQILALIAEQEVAGKRT
jgi:glycosyltransferase involved in cell wall biosynthesis